MSYSAEGANVCHSPWHVACIAWCMTLLRRLGWTICVAPLFAALALVGPGMVSRADGCSGGPNNTPPPDGWSTLFWQSDLTAPADAVLVFSGGLSGMDAGPALAAVTVTLTDPAGADVPGTLSLVPVDPSPAGNVLVVFKPAASLAAGAAYKVHWEVEPSVQSQPWLATSGDDTLKTVTGPSIENAPATEPAVFGRKPELTGEPVQCDRGPYGCPPTTSFGSEEILRPTLTLSWSYVEGPSSQYQLTTIEPIAGKGELLADPDVEMHIAHKTTTHRTVTVTFADELEEYCVRLVTRDLRDGSELVSDPLCAKKSEVAPGPSLLEQALSSCLAPPTEALSGAWCKSHADDEQCQSESPSEGCGLSPGPAREGGAGLLLLCAALVLSGRRRSR